MDIKELEDKFLQHALKAKKDNERLVKEFIEKNPGEPLSPYLTETFSLPEALACMCREIDNIKAKMKWKTFKGTELDKEGICFIPDCPKPHQEWVSVKDSLPVTMKDYLFFTGKKECVIGFMNKEPPHIDRWATESSIWINDSVNGKIATATHWMPLPEDPEMKEIEDHNDS